MTRKQAGHVLGGLSERGVRELAHAGVLTEIPRAGRETLVTAQSVESAGAFLASRKAPEPQGATA
jgi:hypothetical protein